MKRRTLFAAALLLLAAPPLAHAWLAQKAAVAVSATSQVLMGKASTPTSTAGDRYFSVSYVTGAAASPGNTTLFPVGGRMTGIKFWAQVAPTGTQTWTATLYKNAVSTALTCQVTSSSSPAGICTGTGNITFAAGDTADLLVHPANNPNSTTIAASFIFVPTAPNDTIITGIGSAFSNSAVNASHPFLNASAGSTATRRYAPFPDGGTIDTLRVNSTAPGAAASGKAYDFSFGKSGVASVVTCNVLETATGCTDGTHSASVAGPSGGGVGDDIQLQGSPTGTPTAATATFAMRYRPTTAGSFGLWSVGQGTGHSTGSVFYYPVSGGNSAVSSIESAAQNITHAMTLSHLTVNEGAISGIAASGKHRTFTLRVNGVDTALTCDIFETASTCSDTTHSVTVADNDLIVTSDTPFSTPGGGVPGISYLAHQ